MTSINKFKAVLWENCNKFIPKIKAITRMYDFTDIGFSKKHRPRKRDAALLAAKGDSASKKTRFL